MNTPDPSPELIPTGLIMVKTAGSSDMFYRPYTADVGVDTLQNLEYELLNSEGGLREQITPYQINQVAPELLRPTAAPYERVNIPEGWGAPRARFVLRMNHARNENVEYVIQGYTDPLDVTPSGLVDPALRLHINSITQTSVVVDHLGTTSKMVTGTYHVIGNPTETDEGLYLLRPTDVFTGLEGMYTFSDDDTDTHHTDMRYHLYHEGKTSKRSNNIPGEYVSDLLNSWSAAEHTSITDGGYRTPLALARLATVEKPMVTNPLARLLTSVVGTASSSPSFTLGSLVDMGMPPQNMVVTGRLARPSALTMEGDERKPDHPWSTSTQEAQAASILAQSVPSIMSDLLISNITFVVTTIAGGKHQIAITGAMSLTGVNSVEHFETFKHRLLCEVISGVTFNGQIPIFMEGSFDLVGESYVGISFYGDAHKHLFDIPTFCDSMMTPVLSPPSYDNRGMFGGFETIMNTVCTR